MTIMMINPYVFAFAWIAQLIPLKQETIGYIRTAVWLHAKVRDCVLGLAA